MITDDPAQLAEMRRALLEQRLRAGGSRTATQPRPVVSHPRPGPLPLSVSQTQLWYLSQLAPDSRAYNELIMIQKTGPLNVHALQQALNEVVRRHESWRTTFGTVDGVPHQFVQEPTKIDLPLLDLSQLAYDEAERQAIDIAVADTVQPYDLVHGPLIRPRLIRIADHDHRLYIGLHHLIWDGTTLHRVVFPELIALYRSYASDLPPTLPEPKAQYADYTAWEREWVAGPVAAARIARWRNRLAGVAPTQLPVDHARPPRQRFVGGVIPLRIDYRVVGGLSRAARRVGGTFFHTLAAAYAWWLYRYTESTDVVFGIPHDLRQRRDLLAVAGYCVTPVVVRCQVTGRETFIELIDRMRRVITDAISDAVPFETLVSGLGVPRDPRNNPLFQTALVLEPPMTSPADDWSLHLMQTEVGDAVGSTKFDIAIELDERPEGHVDGRFFFSTDLFERPTAHAMTAHWLRLLQAVAAAPDIPIAEHDLVTPAERERHLSIDSPAFQEISSVCIHDVIAAQSNRTPDAVAVQVGDDALTYRQLDDRAAVIASRLVQAGAGPGTIVAVLLDRTPNLVAAIVGILKSGAAFIPLDPRQPAARNTFCVSDAGAKFVVTERKLSPGWDAVRANVVNLGDLVAHTRCRTASSHTNSPTDLAYVVYTSGSTGRPKGVLIEHRSVTNLMRTMFSEVGVAAGDTVLSVASISFDMALGDIFCALACGARLVLATAEQATNPTALSRLIAHSDATYLFATPTTWGALVAAGWHGNRRLTAMVGGETLTDGLVEALLERCGPVFNAYGPTETTVVTSVTRLAKGDTITVGRPLPGVQMYITDPIGRPQPIGVPGEIVIGGIAVGRGYLNRPDEHARRFGDDPFHPGGRLFRTSDRGRLLPDGRIQHLGRYDDQLKIRGFRIEPGEIESSLSEHPDVGCCAVVAREAPNGDKQLVAYIVGQPGPNGPEARDWLRRRLPEYMVPSSYVHLGALPTTASGKLDKAALPAPSPPTSEPTNAQPPRNNTERRVAALWADLLATPVTNVNSDFYDMGGHSLLAARLISNAQREFGVELSLAAFIDLGRTVAGLAELIDAQSSGDTGEAMTGAPLHFIFASLASAMSLRHFTSVWGAAQPVQALVPEQAGGLFDRSMTIEQHARQALSRIRYHQPDGPLALAGYSIGGLVAYEVARQAVDAGQQVSWLGILDTPAPSMSDLLRAQLTLQWRLRRLQRQPARERWAKYAEVAVRLLRSGELWPAQEDFDYRGAAEIAAGYQPPGHDVPMHLFVTEGSAADAQAKLLGWDNFHKGTLTVHPLAGNHVTLLDLPEVEKLARIMLESLGKAQATRIPTQAAHCSKQSQNEESGPV